MRLVAEAVAEAGPIGKARQIDGPAFYPLLRSGQGAEQHVLDRARRRSEGEGQRVGDGELHQ
jgi:hypothetical protein